MNVIDRYRMRRAKRLDDRGYRKDDETEWITLKNGVHVPVENGKAVGGPIEGNSVSKGRTIKHGATTYTNVEAKKVGDRYVVSGDMKQDWSDKTYSGATFAHFGNKDEMFACLQEYGVDSVKDPDTGEIVNPVEMDLPKTVGKIGEKRYTDLVLGMRTNKSGRPYEKRGYTLTGKDFDGKKTVIGVFDSPEKAKKYARETMGCKPDNLRESKDYRALLRTNTKYSA